VRFHRHPVCVAALLALAGGAQALPQGATVVAGQAAVQTPTPQLQVVTQGTPQAIIDWRSFSIAAGEKVRFDQPSSTAVLLNRVTGYDPSAIFGQMQANGRIFLLNPYGVVFGAGARIDVGGLVASSLSLANEDFLAGRYSLTSVDPAAPAVRGAVRNEGTINAPGGTVALVGPTVANTGTIVADGGRVGLAATNQVSVDVEGDGLIFFQTSATDARVRLDQLGSIRADGGSVELRAAARGAFADTVLNLEGVVRAHSLGSRAGRVVIDGGEAGITRVAGTVDATGLGTGERGGQATVTGYDVLLDNGARVDARGAAGGGTVLVGGNWHGQGPERNADQTIVNPGASIDVSATAGGNGGTAVVWADYRTQYRGSITARGGAAGGDGGQVETSGKEVLQAYGSVDASAPQGRAGTWLLDPNNITIKNNAGLNANVNGSFSSTDDNAVVDTAQLGAALTSGANVVVTTFSAGTNTQLGDITVQDATNASTLTAGQTATLTLRAQRNIVFTGGTISPGSGSLNVNLQAGTDVGATDTPGTNASTIAMDTASSINTGTGGNFTAVAKNGITLGGLVVGGNLNVVGGGIAQTATAITVTGTSAFNAGAGTIALATSASNNFVGAVTLNATGATVAIADVNAMTLAAPTLGAATALTATAGTTLTLPAGAMSAGAFDFESTGGALATAGALTATNGITLVGSTSLTIGHALTSTNGPVTLTGGGAGGLTLAAATTVDAGSGTIAVSGGGGPIQLNTGTLTTTSASASAITVGNATTVALGTVSATGGGVVLGSAQDITAGVTQTAATAISADTLSASTAGSIDLSKSNAINKLGGVTRGGTLTLNDVGGGLTVTGDVSGGTTTNAVSITTTGGALALGTAAITTTGANNLTLTGVGVTQTTGTISVGGTTSVTAGSGAINLQSTTNAFTGAIDLSSTGAQAAVRSTGNLVLGTLTLGGNTGLTAIAGGALSGLGGAINTGTGAIDLESLGSTLTTPGNLTTSNAAITLVGANGLTVANNLASGGGAISLTGGAAGGVTVNNGRNVNAGGGTIAIDGGGAAINLNNSTLTSTSAGASAITVHNATTVTLGGITANSGTFVLGTAGDISGAVTATNGTTVSANTLAASTAGSISLGTGGGNLSINRLGPVASGDLTLVNNGALTVVGAVAPATGSNASITASGGALALGAQNITVSGAGTLSLKGAGLSQTAGGAIVTGSTATLDAGGNSIDLQAAGNHFGGAVTLKATGTSVAIQDSGALTLATPTLGASTDLTAIAGTTLTLPAVGLTTNGNLDFRSLGGTLATAGALNAANIALTGSAGLAIGHSLTASGGVTLTTTNSDITQSAGTINASTASSFAAGTGTVSLGQANRFSSIGGTGGAVTISENSGGGVALDAINAASLTVTTAAGANVTQTAPLAISGTTQINTSGGGGVTLANNGNSFGSFGATAAGGGAVSVAAGGALALDAINAATLTVNTSSGNGAVTQTAALTVTGLMTVNAGSGSVNLTAAGNALGSFGATAGAVSLREDSAAIALDNVNASSLGVDTSALAGTISQVASKTLTITGAAAFNAGTGTVNIGNTGNSFGSVGATGGSVTLRASSIALDTTSATTLLLDTSAANGTVTQNGAAVVTGLTTVNAGTGDITLTNAANDFSATGINVTGGAVRLRDVNDLVIAGISQGANKDLSLTAGNAITGLAGNIDTGTANLTLSAGTSFTTFGTLRGTNVAITGSGGISLGHDVTALGTLALTTANAAIGQTAGHITAGGTTTVTAGTGTVTLTQGTNDFGTVNVVSGSTVSIHDTNNLAIGATASGDLTVDAGGVLSTSNPISGVAVSLQGTGGITLGHNVTATNGLQLTSTNTPITQTGGAITATGLTTVTAGTGDITLTRPLNDFDDVAGINASGGAVRLTDKNALTITGLSVGLNKDLSLTAGTTLSGVSGNIDTGSGNLTLSAGTAFSTFGTLRGTDITLFGATGVTIGHAITALGNLNLGTTNAPIDQTAGTISAGGTTTATAGSGAITLNLPGNNFNTFAATGGAVTVSDTNAIALGPITATSLTVDTSANNGAITSAGALTVTGNTTLNAGSGAITLGNTGNDFADVTVTGGAISLTDKNALVLNGVNATSLAVDTSTGNGAVTQAAAITVTNAVTVNAGTGNVTFTLAGNTFGSFGATGTTVTLAQAGPVVLGAINATTLSVDTSSANGAISQNAAATVTGTATFTAGNGSISLTQAGNNFGTVAATGGAVSITDVNALVLGAISASSLSVDTSAGNGAVTQSAAATVSGATTVNAGTGAVTLTQSANDFGSVAATGGAVSIRDANAIVLGTISATTLSVDTSAGGGAITQSGNATVTGATTVNAGSGAVALTRAGNDFATLAVTGGAVSVVDANALTLTTLASGANQAVSVTAGGALTLPATAIDTGTAALTLSSGGTLDTVGTLRGTNVALSAGGTMTIANDVTALGTLNLTAANAPITQTGGRIVAAGLATVDAGASGDVQLAQATNDFQGGLALRGGALDVHDTNDLSVTSLVAAPNHAVTLRAGGTLVLPVAAIDTGTADLVLQALGGALVINGALHGNNVTLTGATGLTLGADIVSSGSQIYTSPVALGADITLDAGANKIDLQGGVTGAGHDLALKSTNAAADALHTGAPVTNIANFSVTGNATLGGNVVSTGDQTYAGQVTLATGVTLDSGAAKIALQSGLDAAGHAVALKSTNAAADAIRADGAIGNASQLDVTGKSTFATGVSTTGAQTYSDTVTLGGTATFSGSSLTFANGIAGGTSDVVLRADALSLAGTVAGSGNATLAPFTASSSVGVAGGAGTLAIPQATLDAFAGFTTLTLGRSDGTGDLNFGSFVLPANLAVTSASGNASFGGTVASAAGLAHNLTVTTGGLTSFSGAVGGPIGGTQALGQLTVTGATLLGASVTTTGAQGYGGALTVGADATLSGSAVNAAGALAIDTHTVAILADAITVGGPATGAAGGSLRVAPHDATGTLGIAGGVGTLQMPQALVDTLAGVPSLILGRADGSATVNVGNLVLPGNLTVASGTGDVAFGGTVDSAAGPAHNLAVTTAGTTTFGATVGAVHPVGTLAVTGPVQLGASIASTGAQSYGGTATLVADTTLSGSSVAFATTVDGSHALVVNAGATSFGGAVGATVPLASLATDAAGTTQLGGNVTTTGAQRYDDALVLNADATLAGSTLTLAGRVDGAQSLTLNGATGTSLGQPVGATTPLAALTTTGPLQLAAGSVTTSGAQAYGGAVTLGAATTLTGSAVSFAGTLDGGFALTLPGAGLTTFGDAVGGTTRLASLGATGAVAVNGPGVLTIGTQTYGGAVQVAGDAHFSGTALTFGGAVSGAHDLDLEANTLTAAAGLAGTGTLAIAPLDPALGVGVAGGPGALQVPQSILDGASGFTSHIIGRTDGTGTLAAGNLVLRANTTLQSGSGDVRLNGSVDGAFDLALNSGGTTRIAGPIGATTPLRSLTTDNNPAAADFDGTSGEHTLFDSADATGRARVITTGAQTYGDPVVATVPIRFVGGTITADQATSRFDAGVAATADSLQLKSATALRLDDVTLANGGRIETDGVLQIAGTLRLDGGTLTLVSNATPTGVPFTDPELQGRVLTVGFVPLDEASATILQNAGATLSSAPGTLLVLRSPHGGTMQLDQPGNTLQGDVSAVSGTLGDNDTTRFTNATNVTLGFVRLTSSEIHVAGAPPTDGNQALAQAGIEGDVVKLSTDLLTTGTTGQIRARLPFNNLQGSQTSVPALTLVLGPNALLTNGGFGSGAPDTFIQVRLGADDGGYLTVRPKGVGQEHLVFLGGPALIKPFYDGSGKITEIRVFYNGDAPRTPQETGALAAVTAVIEEARNARFEEAVRTENVTSRLRSGVIAEVGAGRPATVGREGVRRPDSCDIKPGTLRCE
jgi:filamentous hemagglutinin family protein